MIPANRKRRTIWMGGALIALGALVVVLEPSLRFTPKIEASLFLPPRKPNRASSPTVKTARRATEKTWTAVLRYS